MVAPPMTDTASSSRHLLTLPAHRERSTVYVTSRLSVPPIDSSSSGGFAAERGRLIHSWHAARALSSRCGQRHVTEPRINTDLAIFFVSMNYIETTSQ